ncbi:uncharacterized protein LOC109828953 [Asparagus officinalis]|uniref:uncharacterized protein LOC109828953 n=1 Tax=Asparagus officinalis TaxID=4686 RepID=UPI00098DFE72|nr:uncharacterized protein LOC109828953 [Asparagus officinalis]
MASSTQKNTDSIIGFFVGFLLATSFAHCSLALETENSTEFRPAKELLMLRRTRALLKKINKPSLKTIQSPDGDIIDCVPSHLQPAFDHPKLRGKKPLNPTERPEGNNGSVLEGMSKSLQLWRDSGEFCPEESVPIRRTTENDLLRVSALGRFGRKPTRRVRRDSSGTGHEHAVGYVSGDKYYGAKASLNVWAPKVTAPSEFTLSQIWVISGPFSADLNTIEAGWQVNPELYGDSLPRFFTYWTSDAYQETGCYNLFCSGFVQTNNKFAIGATISPNSEYNGRQFDVTLLIWKDPKNGHWWLEYGSGLILGYWPSFLFNHLTEYASMIQFGGEIVNSRPSGVHTSTEMGSGHFANKGFRRAAYFRNLQVVDWDNNLIPLSNLHLFADHSSCYGIKGGVNEVWGNYFYYGGPGRCMRCP